MSLGNPFMSNCPSCGQPMTMMQMGIGHQCTAPDPRIMAELKSIRDKLEAIHTALDKIWTRTQA